MKSAPRSLKSRALQLLAQREYSRTELRRKLREHAADAPAPEAGSTAEAAPERGVDGPAADAATDPSTAVDALLDWLEARRFLSMDRFIESRLNARSGRFGNQRIRSELAQHDVRLPPEADRLLRETELDRARLVWQRKFAAATGADPPDAAGRARQSRFLAGRGFTSDVIARVMREAARRSRFDEVPPADD